MKLIVVAVGRLKAGPERELCERYLKRLQGSAKTIGISAVQNIEITESPQRRPVDRMAEEAAAVLGALPGDARLIVFDERGSTPDSGHFARQIEQYRGEGVKTLAVVIGGPDGMAPVLRERAALVVAFGKMTMPHQIVRALVYEQIYRAATILSGHPYHRS